MPRTFIRCLCLGRLAPLVLTVALIGCGHEPPSSSTLDQPASSANASGSQSNAPPAVVGALVPLDTWDVVYLGGNRVGYIHSQSQQVDRDGRTIIQSTADTRLWLTRFGQASDQKILVTSAETPAGALLDFKTEAQLGPQPMICRGHVDGDKLLIEATAGGQTTHSEMAWNGQIGGFTAVEQELARRPMEPGQTREFKLLMPLLNEVLLAEVRLTARDYVSTSLLAGDYELLEIDSETTLSGGKMGSRMWVNRKGEILKTRMDAFNQETFRTTREVALERLPEQPFDLGFDSVVRIDPPLDDPHAAKKIRYRVELADGDPASVFTQGGTQSTKLLGPHAIELTVERRRPGEADETAAEPNPGADDSAANGLIQSNDPQVMELARKAAGNETDPWKTALALEQFVHDHITTKSFSQAFATAAEVAAHPEGDCTEHAVLLAALARARGIPARVATGLVYIGSPPGFGFHMWDEVYIAGHWIPLDATLARGGIGAGHIKLAHSNLKEATALGCFLPVAQVLGKLKIEVLEVD